MLAHKKITEDLGADSLCKVECIMRIEEAFNIEIPDHEARFLITIEDIINYVDRKINVVNK